MSKLPAFLIGGTHSGCGKTTVSLGIMAALKARKMRVQPFKCGPDFIDPTLHYLITGRISRNLDIRMCGEEWVRSTFTRNLSTSDCGVVEGVMGLFDGGDGSAATLAKSLNLPAFLVIDVRSAAESIAAIVKGFSTLDPQLNLAGVICNRVGSERHRQLVEEAIVQHTTVPVVGFIPRKESITIPSRHLGLHMGEENPLQGDGIQALAELMETHLDLDAILKIAMQYSVPLDSSSHDDLYPKHDPAMPRVRIGVARDQAFCFYYEDNLDLLTAAGAELVPFSPLTDHDLPENLDGLYLGGGYPELFAEQLSDNRSMRQQIHAFCQTGSPVYAECGGFMYLTREITNQEGLSFPMTGVFPFVSHMQNRLRRLGYRTPLVTRDTFLANQGTTLYGHEFHYSTVDMKEGITPCAYTLQDGQEEGYLFRRTLAGYVHLHWGRTPQAAVNFVQACRNEK
ncbi:cobyrinate a,c-diamide synthase [Desulfogranum japonicum]|uniref:cobyrinate a,c-diamide synthase n=1 Tax=Desulfogranum japonicum TaxID=231447 RepID=UPI0003FFC55C|nr:cobyrinate a,c-diamide synthase [Desulfogranum japonicum]